MKSMTGFGSAEHPLKKGGGACVEVSSLNRKQLDIRVTAPEELAFYEIEVRRMVQAVVGRGSVVVKIYALMEDDASAVEPEINEKVAGIYLRKLRKLKDRLGLVGEPSIADLLTLPGVVNAGARIRYDQEFVDAVGKALGKALEKLDASRLAEASFICGDLLKRVHSLEAVLGSIEQRAAGLVDVAKKRLMDKIKEAGLSIGTDDERLLKEVLLFADRSDVSEEITRLRSHLAKFQEMLGSNEPVGRSLDFLSQEIQREINTLANKTPNIEISPLVVTFKTEVEKIREQVQNLE